MGEATMKYVILSLAMMLAVGCGQGPMGPAGPKGDTGEQGIQGEQGNPGADGVGCTVTSVGVSSEAPNGGSLITCANGSSLVLNGTNGANGLPGTPGTIIQSVQLCPGTTTYPSKFIEVAFKFGGKLWAVYSINNGFLTEIPPGNYSSNALNSSCNFTVNADLSISH